MKNSKTILLSTAYLAPIQYFLLIANAEKVIIESNENYTKQSYRNRCEIYGANGKLPLSIPIKKSNSIKTHIKDIQIDYSTSWQRLHWISIESAYLSSPFFEYYMDEFHPFYEKNFKFLFDYNLELFNHVISILDIDTKITLTNDFIPLDTDNEDDYRFSINPKRNSSLPFNSHKYMQVFNDKHGFIPNLSILDLICNEGPNAESFLLE